MPRLQPLSKDSDEKMRSYMEDSALVAACLRGDAPSWDALISRYAALLFSVCLKMGLSQADSEDVFQDVCIILLNHLEDLRDSSRLSGWLISTTKREVWRRQKRRGALLASELGDAEWEMEAAQGVYPTATQSPEVGVIALEEQQMMRLALNRLAERCRRLLTLLYVNESPASYQEIALELALPVGSIGPTRARCLQNLRKLLKECGF